MPDVAEGTSRVGLVVLTSRIHKSPSARSVSLTKGYSALVDASDYERVMSKAPWCVLVTKSKRYATRKVRRADGTYTTLYMHRFIAGVTDPEVEVDHEDGDGLNNRRYNLRPATSQQNTHNQKKTRGNSQYKGVYWHKMSGKWVAHIAVNGKAQRHLGSFTDEVEAARAYDAAAIQQFGEFAHTNF